MTSVPTASGVRFQPVILGADVLGYTFVRELNRYYGVRPILIAGADVRMTTRTRLADVVIMPDSDQDEALLAKLASIAQGLDDGVVPVVIAAASDWHVRLLSEHKDRLRQMGYVVPYIDFDLLDSITQKDNFYAICERLGIPYPRTWVLPMGPRPDIQDGERITVIDSVDAVADQPFPLIVKPSNSATWHYADVEDKHKVYRVAGLDELRQVVERVQASDYRSSLLIQEMISEEDTSIHILTTFGTGRGDAVTTVTGDVFVQDRSPSGIGNPLVILGDRRREDLARHAEAFVRETGYEGFANFDIMDDAQGRSYFLEINTRPGRSSYFYCLAGCSIVRPMVEHYVMGRDLRQALTSEELAVDREFLFTLVPRDVIREEVHTPEQWERAKRLFDKGVWGNPLFNPADGPRQRFWARVSFENMRRKFRAARRQN